jgi:hypothetical protein
MGVDGAAAAERVQLLIQPRACTYLTPRAWLLTNGRSQA